MASETTKKNQAVYELVKRSLPGKECEFMTHEELKALTGQVKFAVRTGEGTPFANVVVRAGVVF